VSAAAYRAVWQLIRAPFYWEKTEHGVSSQLKPNQAHAARRCLTLFEHDEAMRLL